MSGFKFRRRDFLKTTAGIAAAGTAAPYVWTSSYAKAQEPAGDKLNVASIGTSLYIDRGGHKGKMDGRGARIGHQAGQLGNMVAVCDVNRLYAEAFASRYDGKCEIYSDYRKLLERKDVEAVTIGTPDHWHTAIAIAALKAGIDVYCEKPLTLTIDESKMLCKVVKETGRVFQVGTQQRSECGNRFLKAVAIARSGRLGKKLHAISSVGGALSGGPFPAQDPPAELDWDFWLGPAPKVPYCPNRCDYDFRWWLEYSGGQVTDWGVHHTDIALWALGGEDTGVVEAEGKGDFPGLPEDVNLIDFLAGKVKIPPCYNVAHNFDCNLALPNGNTINLVTGNNELIIEGEKGRIRVNRGGLTGKLIEEINSSEADKKWLDEEIAKLYRNMPLGSHMGNFFHCVKTRELPISDVYTHCNSVNACHMANIAMLLKRKVRFDPNKRQFIDDAEANQLLSRPQREPYTIEA